MQISVILLSLENPVMSFFHVVSDLVHLQVLNGHSETVKD